MARKLRLVIRGFLFFGLAVFFISGGFSIPGLDSKAIGSESESSSKDSLPEYPVVRVAMVDPIKVTPGDKMIISAEIEDKYGVKEVTADMGGVETVRLKLVKGTVYHGHWQAKWLVHDTERKEYVATFKVVNFKRQEAQALVYWADAYCACSPGTVGPTAAGRAYIGRAKIINTEVQDGDYSSGQAQCSNFTGFTFATMRIGEFAHARVLAMDPVHWACYWIGFFWDSDMDGDLDSSDSSGSIVREASISGNTEYGANFGTSGHKPDGAGNTRWRYYIKQAACGGSTPGPCSTWAYGEIEDYTVKFCLGDGIACTAAAQCCSNKCLGSKCCPTNHCSNSIQDCDETGSDCGGIDCPSCCKANGQTCTLPSECCSTYCKDGYCCNSSCTGTCQRCDSYDGTAGTCHNIASPHDPDNECTEGSYSCSGSCQRTIATAGYCNGSGACTGAVIYNIADSKVCSGGNEVNPSATDYCANVISCTNNTCTADSYNRACNGSGLCRTDNTYAFYVALTDKVCINGIFTTTVGIPWYLSTTCNLNNVNISLQDDLYVQSGGTLNLTGTTNITTSCDADSCGDYVYVYPSGTIYIDDTAGFNK